MNTRFASSTGALEASLRLTAVALLLRPTGPWYVRPAILAAAAVMLISPRALATPWLWASVAALIGVRIASDWPLADNHIYLLAYWCLAIAIALRDRETPLALAAMSRSLLGLAFAFAVIWKAALSPDYLDGRFFRVTFLTDPRLVESTLLAGGLTAAQLATNQRALSAVPEGAQLLVPPAIYEPGRFRAVAVLSTWGVLAAEAAVALAMLWPPGVGVTIAKHALLLGFCAVTYTVAPVAGFGWLLVVMGLAQAEGLGPWLRRAYIGTFLLVLFSAEVPWPALLRRVLGHAG